MVIVIGASAGGVEGLQELVRGLPADFPAPIFVVVHFPSYARSVLPQILARAGVLPAAHAENGEAIVPGRIYVAPPDYHLLLKKGSVRVVRGPRENRHRPAIDPLFRSAARVYGKAVVGVILSGYLDDGSAGLRVIKAQGGRAVILDPDTTIHSEMPRRALEHVQADHICTLEEIPALLMRLALEEQAAGGEERVSEDLDFEVDIAELDPERVRAEHHPGTPSRFGCPECGGVLWEIEEPGPLRFRCRVGHAYTADTLLSEQTDSLEAALWSAMRALEEKASLAHRLHKRAHERGHEGTAERFLLSAREAEQQAELVRQVLLREEVA